MREIIFRGKRVDNGEWIEGTPIILHDKQYIVIGGEFPVLYEPIIPETVCQFTGEIDTNGNRIFEGDILLFDDDQKSEVKWLQGGLTCEANFGDYDLTTVGWAMDILGGCEVVGNIHDKTKEE